MSRSLPITAAQITAICKGAAKAGFVAELEIGGVKIRLIPEHLASDKLAKEKASVAWKGEGYL